MRVAVTVWGDRISPLFDATRMLLIVTIADQKIVERRYERLDNHVPMGRISWLQKSGVQAIICGGISDFFINLIEAQGIRIVPFASGNVNDVLEAFLASSLSEDA